MVVMTAKRQYVSDIIEFVCNTPAEVFHVFQELFNHSPGESDSDHMMALCNQFVTYFVDIISQIYSELDLHMDAIVSH